MNNILKTNFIYYYSFFIVILFFISPRISGGLRLDEILAFIFLFSHLLFVLKYNNHIVSLYFFFTLISFFLSLLSNVLYSDIIFYNWIYFFKYCIYLSFLICGFLLGKKTNDTKQLIYVVFICFVLNFIWMSFQYVSGNYRVLIGLNEAASYGLKLIGEGAAFQVGSLISLMIFSTLIFYFNKKGFLLKSIFLLIFFILFVFLYMTESRVSLVASLIGSILIFINKSKIFFKLFVSGIVFLIIFIFSILRFYDYSNDNNRFTLSGIVESYNVRGQEIWSLPIEIFSNNIFYPNGLGALTHYNTNTNEMHNFYLKLMFEGGIFYFFIYMLFLFLIFCLRAKNKFYSDWFLVLKVYALLLFISAFFQDSFSSNKAVIPMFFLLGYCLALNVISRNKAS